MRRSVLWLGTAMLAGNYLIGPRPGLATEPQLKSEPQPISIASYFAESETAQPDGNPGESSIDAPGSTQAGEETDISSAPPSTPASGPAKPKKKPDLKKAAAGAYKDPFYNNDFSYLNNPAYNGYLLGEELKQLHPSCCTTLDIGGQYRARFHREQNMRGLGLTGVDDTFLLHRTRLYSDLRVGEDARVYAEYFDAVSEFEDFAPRGIEEDRSDFLNLFADYRLIDDPCGDLWARVGRQELLYGSQRLVSPLDWANTRRTFDGAKVYYRGEDWDVDGFWVRPVLVDVHNFDAPDQDQEFYSLWTSYKGIKDESLDLYWIGYADYAAPYVAAQDFVFQTVGGRYLSSAGPLMAEVEGGYQFGDFGALDHAAGFFTLGAGWKDVCHGWKPSVWAYYDWASGDETRGNGFNHLFPLGHKYMGYMDLFARSNIEDVNFLFEVQPEEKLKLQAWWHIFYLQDGEDVPYRINMQPYTQTAGGNQYLGQELDLLANWSVTPRFNMVFGYSHFFTGSWFRTNPTPPATSEDADFYYVQSTLNF